MPIDLYQRLSEFSYGYGVTREVERLLASVGLCTTPFLPSLLAEGDLGFDVSFDRPGIPLLLQFKLGEVLQRFVRSDKSQRRPILDKPFWRYKIDTAEPGGQYSLLLSAERCGAEVYYVAPRFSNWSEHANAFETNNMLERSLLISPLEIDNNLITSGAPDGMHRIVYDQARVYVFSEPVQIKEVNFFSLANDLRSRIKNRNKRMGDSLKEVFGSFSLQRELRMPIQKEKVVYLGDKEDTSKFYANKGMPYMHGDLLPSPQNVIAARDQRLANFLKRSRSEDDAFFASVGIETWALGSQLIAVTINDQ